MPGRWVVVVPLKDAAAGKTRLSGALDDRARTALARAMALDTIASAAACEAVGVVVVVTADHVVAAEAVAERPRDDRPAAEAVGGQPPDDRPEAVDVAEQPRDDRPATGAVGGQPPEDRAATEASGRQLRTGGAAIRVIPEPPHAGARSGLDAAAAAGVAHARTLAPAAPVAVLLGDLPALRPEDLGAALVAAAAHARAVVADSQGTGTTLLALTGGEPFDSRFGAGSAAAHRELGFVDLALRAGSTLRRDIDLPADLDSLRSLDPGPHTKRLLERLFPDEIRGAGRPA